MRFSAFAVVFSVCALLGACDDEPGPLEHEQMRVPDAGPVAIKVTNAGAGCSLLNRNCEGDAAQCLEISYSGAYYPGGYCTADCKLSEECGPNAACPVGEAERVSRDYRFRSTWARKCFRTCTPGVASTCRSGYACMSLAEVYVADDAPPPMHAPVCVPRWPTFGWDAGTPSDAGILRTLDAGR
jgi:hypothetical protein